MEQPTGYSAPLVRIRCSLAQQQRLIECDRKGGADGKLRPTPAVPALVATFANVNAHNASQVNVSSGSEILSVTSSIERLRRAQLARAQLELADA